MTDVRSTIAKPPRLPFERIAQNVLGNSYTLSVVLCGDQLATRLNSVHRKKTYRPNVLSFPLSQTEGEIFLNVRCAEREARAQLKNVQEHIVYLFIHACLHLKGFDHGALMETEEAKHVSRFRQMHR